MSIDRPSNAAELAQDLAAVFARELEEQLAAAAAVLGQSASSPPAADGCRELARIFHTIKGGAGLIGRDDLAAAAATLEHCFADSATAAPSQAALDALFDAAGLSAPPVAGTRAVAPPQSTCAPEARVRVVLVQAGTVSLALPIHAVARAAVVPMRDVAWGEQGAVLLLGGARVDAVALAALVGQPLPRARAVALCLAGAETRAVLVDRISTPRELAVLPLPRLLAAHPFLAGVAVDAEGTALCVLDAPRLMAAAVREPQGEAAPVPAARVLVVDDSRVVRDAISSVLRGAGIPFDTAVDGCDALGKLAGGRAAAMVTDVEMPRMDGLVLIETLRADPRWRSMPVLLCTSRAHGLEPDRLRALGVAGVVSKPFDRDALLTEVRRLLADAAVCFDSCPPPR